MTAAASIAGLNVLALMHDNTAFAFKHAAAPPRRRLRRATASPRAPPQPPPPPPP